MSTARLPKIQPPEDEETRRLIVEASELASSGDMKGAQTALRQVVSSGKIVTATQRQVLAWWSAGEYNLPGFAPAAADGAKADNGNKSSGGEEVARQVPPARSEAARKKEEYEANVVKVMRFNNWCRKKAEQYIEEGGLEMEEMQKEMYSPMDDAFDKLKQAGPPQWFIDAMMKNQAESEGGGTDSAIADSDALPIAASLPPAGGLSPG